MNNPAIMLQGRDLKRRFDEAGDVVEVLKGVDLDIYAGERIAIVGSSGSGKSTLLNILCGLDRPSEGEVQIAGTSLAGLNENQLAQVRNQNLGFVFQFHHLLNEFTALENVSMPLLMRDLPLAEVRSKAELLLDRVGLSHRLRHKPAQLSGGERQRVAIARALVSDPKLVLMDEPTGNLDQHTGDDIKALMLELNLELRTAFVVVTHDMQLADSMDRVLRLNDGLLATPAFL